MLQCHVNPLMRVQCEHGMVIPGPSPGYLSQYSSFPGPPMATCHSTAHSQALPWLPVTCSTVSFPGPPLATCYSTAHSRALPWLPVTVRLIPRPSHGYLSQYGSFPGPPLATCHSTAHSRALPWLPVSFSKVGEQRKCDKLRM